MGDDIQLEARPTATMSLARVVVRSGGRCLWSAHRSHRYSKTETSPPSVWLRAVAESTGQYVLVWLGGFVVVAVQRQGASFGITSVYY
jgi:hypothetical protein